MSVTFFLVCCGIAAFERVRCACAWARCKHLSKGGQRGGGRLAAEQKVNEPDSRIRLSRIHAASGYKGNDDTEEPNPEKGRLSTAVRVHVMAVEMIKKTHRGEWHTKPVPIHAMEEGTSVRRVEDFIGLHECARLACTWALYLSPVT